MKKVVFFALSLVMVFGLAACTRNAAPSVTPSPSNSVAPGGTAYTDNGVDGNNATQNGGVIGDIGNGVGDVADGVGDAVGDAARGIGDAARNMTR